MDLKQLKQRIIDDGTIGLLLKELGCDNIKPPNYSRAGDPLVTASLPDGDNPNGVQIYINENLTTSLVTRGISGDIYSLVGYILYGCQTFDDLRGYLYQVKTYICNALDYEHSASEFIQTEPKVDWNWWLRDIQKERSKTYEVVENKTLDEKIMLEYTEYPWYGWYQEGISHKTQMEFGICFDVQSERVIIPIHNKDGKLIGTKGRYVGCDKKTLDEQKYIYLYPCSKSIELFNLFRAIKHIQEKKKVIVVEGAKTAIMLWDMSIKNVVSIEGDRVSPIQVKLLKELGLDIEYIFAFDKDKDEEFILKQIKQIKNRDTYYLLDTKDRFEEKESPCDRGYETFIKLYTEDLYKVPV